MENQLIRLAIQNLTIENFDEDSLKSIKITIDHSGKHESLEYPFLLSNFILSHIQSYEISLVFSYKSRQFAKSLIKFSHDTLPYTKTFIIQGTSPIELSPEKQRPRKNEDLTDLKSIGQGSICISLENPLLQKHVSFDYCSDLALNLEKLVREQGFLPEKHIENLRVVIVGLNYKLKTLCLLQERLEKTEETSSEHLVEREKMHFSIEETCRALKCSQKDLDKSMENVMRQRAEIEISYEELKKEYREKCVNENQLSFKVKHLENEVEKLKNQQKSYNEIEKIIGALKEQIRNLEKERTLLKDQYNKTIQNFEKDSNTKIQEIQAKDEQNNLLQSEITNLKGQIHILQSNLNDNIRKSILYQSEISELTSKLSSLKDQEYKSWQFEDLSKKHQSECVFLNDKLKKAASDFAITISNLHTEKKKLASNLQTSFQDFSKTKQELDEITGQYRNECVKCQDLKIQIIVVQQKVVSFDDGRKVAEEVKGLKNYAKEINDKLVEENDGLAMFVIKTADDHLSAVRIIDQVKEIVEDRDSEISILRELIADLQNKTNYLPVKEDPVDEAIADYINSRAEPLPVHFIREDYGMYLFGTKRLFLRLENGRITSNL